MLTFRSAILGLFLVTLALASAVASSIYDSTLNWMSDLAYGILDENWKLLLGIWVGLSSRRYIMRVLIFIAGVLWIWVLANLTPIVTGRLPEYVDGPTEVVRSVWLTAWPALAVAVTLAVVQYRYCLFLRARNVSLPSDSSVQFSLRHLLWSFVVAAIVLTGLKLIESRVDMNTRSAYVLSDLLKGASLALIAGVAVWAMFSVRIKLTGVVAILVASVCTTLLIAHSFQRWDALQVWLMFATMQFALCVISMLVLRVAGYRLWRMPADTTL